MHFSTTFIALAAPFLLVSARPVRRDASKIDQTVLQFAFVLEQFETAFYDAGLKKFNEGDFTAAGFVSAKAAIQQLESIRSDECTHVSVYKQALISGGGTPLETCKFKLDGVLGDAKTMLTVGRAVEYLGVSAYLGAAHLINDPVLLTAAASTLTIEARHQTILNLLEKGSTIPNAFDMALNPSEVLATAGQFIEGCDLGLPANKPLMITNTGSVGVGTKLTFASPAIAADADKSKMFCQMMIPSEPIAVVLPFDNCVVPSGINGPVAIFVTSDNNPLANDVVNRAQDKQIAGPTLAFIDTVNEELSSLLRTGGNNNGGGQSNNGGSNSGSGDNKSSSGDSTSTRTISPAEASKILSSASATATGKPSGTVNAVAPPPPCQKCDVKGQVAANNQTGATTNGAITVNGWSVPAPNAAAASSASASPSSINLSP